MICQNLFQIFVLLDSTINFFYESMMIKWCKSSQKIDFTTSTNKLISNCLYPRPNAGIKIYNLIILLVDIVVMLVRWIYFTLESIYLLVVPPKPVDVSKDVVLITGAGHGIGRSLAQQYAALGATVVCVDINDKMNQETVAAIKQQKGNAFGYV